MKVEKLTKETTKWFNDESKIIDCVLSTIIGAAIVGGIVYSYKNLNTKKIIIQ